MILGPYPFDPTLCPSDGNTVSIGTLPTGVAVFAAFVRSTQDINDPTEAAQYILDAIDTTAGPKRILNFGMNVPADLDAGSEIVQPPYTNIGNLIAATKAPADLLVTYAANGSGPDPVTQGAAAIYLIAAPWTP